MKRILLVDDHEVVRNGVRNLCQAQLGEFEFGEAVAMPDALRMVSEQTWDAVVLDLSLGARSGLELLKEIKETCPKLPVLILSMHSEEQYARRAFRAGASGYVTKDSPGEELVKAIQNILTGRRYVSANLAERLVVELDSSSGFRPPQEILSDREFEVMGLIASGKTISAIAQLLCLSNKTISTHRAHILRKMAMKTSAELTHYVIRNNLL